MPLYVKTAPEKGERAIKTYLFYQRFTEMEMLSWIVYINNTANSAVNRARAENLRYMIQLREWVNLDSPIIIAAVNWLETVGILGPGRVDEILR